MKTTIFAIAFIICFGVGTASSQEDLARVYTSKLTQTILPNIEFRSTTLKDAVEFLRQEGRRLDPTANGGAGAGVPVSVELDAQTLDTRLSLSFSRIPLLNAFQYVATQAKMKIEVDSTGLHVRPQQTAAEPDKTVFEASMARARAMYPDVSRGDTPLGKAVTEEIRQLKAVNDPILANLRSPEIVTTRVAGRLGIASTPINAPQPAISTVTGAAHEQAVAASKARVYAQYPELQTAGNEFYDYFVRVKVATQKEAPNYFQADDWPERMADECATRWRTMQANANQATEEERARTVALQNKIAAEQTARPTQRNGQPLPANWIDPDLADARFQAQQTQAALEAARNEAAQARFEAQNGQDTARRAAADARWEAMKARQGW